MDANIKHRTRHIVIVTLLTLILLIVGLLAITPLKFYTTYRIATQDSAAGLAVDSPVRYNGIVVGKVKSIALDQKNPQLVDILLKIKSNVTITNGTVAALTNNGIEL